MLFRQYIHIPERNTYIIPVFCTFMGDSAGKNTVQCSCRRFCVCLVLFPRGFDWQYPAVAVLSGVQLFCETSWYPEILKETKPQVQEPCRGAWVMWVWGRVSNSFPHCSYYPAVPGHLSGHPQCCVEGDLQLLQGLAAQPFVLPLIVLLWGCCRCLLPYPLISRAALVIF